MRDAEAALISAEPSPGATVEIALADLDSPVGVLAIAARGDALCALSFRDADEGFEACLARRYPGARVEAGPGAVPLVERIRGYFAGDLSALDDIAVETAGTPFQREVWAALRRIPVGRTTSYQRLATAIGKPAAVRAVGMANGRNPIALVIPCHRVIAADGTLCGYGGGLWRKEWLLRHERALLA